MFLSCPVSLFSSMLVWVFSIISSLSPENLILWQGTGVRDAESWGKSVLMLCFILSPLYWAFLFFNQKYHCCYSYGCNFKMPFDCFICNCSSSFILIMHFSLSKKKKKMGMTDVLTLSRLETKDPHKHLSAMYQLVYYFTCSEAEKKIRIQAATPYLTCPVVSRYCRVSNKPVVLCCKCCNKWTQ